MKAWIPPATIDAAYAVHAMCNMPQATLTAGDGLYTYLMAFKTGLPC